MEIRLLFQMKLLDCYQIIAQIKKNVLNIDTFLFCLHVGHEGSLS